MSVNNGGHDWMVAYKRKIIAGIVALLTLSVVVAMVLIACVVRDRLLRESETQAEELGIVVHASLSHLMQSRNAERMQDTLEAITRENPSVVRTFILNNNGRIAYSSSRKDIGRTLDRTREESCAGCHGEAAARPSERTMTVTIEGRSVLRHVHIIENQPACHRCHPAASRINGKLVIDRSLEPTTALIRAVVVITSLSALLCLALLIPFLWRTLSAGVNTYIDEVRLKSAELNLLYSIVDRLSATIEIEELKRIIIEIISDALGADEIDMVLPNEYRELGAIVWTRDRNSVARRKVDARSGLNDVIHRWTEGMITEHAIVGEGREILMPIARGSNRLALIIVRSSSERFEPYQLTLVKGMANHIAVAFDNAVLYRMAITDELTGLYSNRHFRHSIGKRYGLFHEFGEKMALLMIDVDNFKRINDTYGHPAGDAILKEIGKCILSAVRDDDMGFRYGGEEFSVLLPSSGVSAGQVVAERMRALIERHPFRIDQHILQVTVSIGVSALPESADNIKELLSEADKGLYEAKHAGKNRVIVRTKEA